MYNIDDFKMDNIEDFILDLADYVKENRKIRRENEKLKEYKNNQEKFMDEMVQTNLKNTVNFLEILSK